MSQVALLLEQMEYTFGKGGWVRTLDQAVAGASAAAAAWKPGPELNTIWQTVNHLTFWKELVTTRLGGAPLTGERLSNVATFGAPGDPANEAGWAEAVARLRAAQGAFRDAVAKVPDAALDAPLPDESTPLRELLLGLNLHDAYHLGQMVVLRKLQGSWSQGVGR